MRGYPPTRASRPGAPLNTAGTGIVTRSSPVGSDAGLAPVQSLPEGGRPPHVAGRVIDHALLEETAKRIARARVGEEGREGVQAFLEHRPPKWTQR